MVKTWSTNQPTVALSSAEAEYYGLVKGATNALGIQSYLKDTYVEVGIVMRTDASAAQAIASRRGLGKVRHIDVAQLWLQQYVADKRIEIIEFQGVRIWPTH